MWKSGVWHSLGHVSGAEGTFLGTWNRAKTKSGCSFKQLVALAVGGGTTECAWEARPFKVSPRLSLKISH